MRNAVIVHGMPSREEYYDPDLPTASSHHWLPWLAKQLLVRDIPAYRPEMPAAFAPDYPTWRREFERYDITPETLLVGHSCGGGFLVRWLSEHPATRVGRVVLVAPWLDPDRGRAPDFFAFTIDPDLAPRTDGLVVFNSDDDSDGVQRSAHLIRDTVTGTDYREFHRYGHFCAHDLGGPRFPELLTALLD
ncbi:RBBP9/YdeN family alpha/beta hydrolase [Planosporangium sp. 12N6]|uniref:RBBP9/YdeN family alpha/beta hydrolase n=1 Tax=Planosporangium spinosum TaxID=3402278 RepID=UPI003CF2AA35